MAQYKDLAGKKILITGATRGIGREITRQLASLGAHIIFSTRKGAEQEALLINEIEKLGGSSTPMIFDMSEPEQMKEQVLTTLKKLGSLDGLVNNAGISKDQLLLRIKPEDITQVLQINLASVIHLTSLCSRFLMKSEGASIINMSSIVGVMGNAGQAVYAASKAGLIGLTKSTAKELASRKVRCNTICPGFISSDMTDALDEKTKESYLSSIPLGDFGKSQDIANLVSFLLSQDSRYITGETFKIDGGLYI